MQDTWALWTQGCMANNETSIDDYYVCLLSAGSTASLNQKTQVIRILVKRTRESGTHPNNFRESWWHNRDYGILVANPFGRAAMKQGEPSSIRVERDKPLRLVFGAMIHSGSDYNSKFAHEEFVNTVRELK